MGTRRLHLPTTDPSATEWTITARPVDRTVAWVALVAPVALALAGLALRLYCLDCRGFWNDEVLGLETVQRGFSAMFGGRVGYEANQTPLYYLTIWLGTFPADPATTTVWVRLPGALAGGLLPPLIYALGREMFGWWQGLLAGILAVLSSALVYYSQDSRPYSLATFLIVGAMYCLMRASRGGAWRWWAGFALAASLALLMTYSTAVLLLPALAPYLVWLALRARHVRSAGASSVLPLMLSFAVVAVVAVLGLADSLNVERSPLDLGKLTPQYAVSAYLFFVNSFIPLQLGGRGALAVQLLVEALALVGVYLGFRRGRGLERQGAALCGLLAFVPPAILVVLGTSNPVLPRYALFCVPFFVLCVSHAVVSATQQAASVGLARRVTVAAGALAATVLVALFAWGAKSYLAGEDRGVLERWPDYRSAAAYLRGAARPADLIIFLERPLHGMAVSRFYWHDRPPAPAYDALDPRLFATKQTGRVFWVTHDTLPGMPAERLAPLLAANGWTPTAVSSFDGLQVFMDDGDAPIARRYERVVAAMEALQPRRDLTNLWRGTLAQSDGNIPAAARAYQDTEQWQNTWTEYFNSAQGFLALGKSPEAWHMAMSAKYDDPKRPELHLWLAERLAAEGFLKESGVERALARALTGSGGNSGGR